jgi:putative SOS response-associated peptidase YedK
LIPGWAKDEKIGYRLINTRSESIFEKPLWKSLITKTRCLIPANGSYEWQKRADGKQPYFIHLQEGRMFMFAGVWTRWHHNHRAWQTYSILTTTPNKEMSPIHVRMPVILHKDDEDHWLLTDQREDIEPLLSPYYGMALQLFEVDRAVNIATVNDQTLTLPINSA